MDFICDIIGNDITRNVIMIIAAATAFIIYILTKRDHFQNAAKIILLEIKDVEKVISDVRSGQIISNTFPVLRSNSWKDYKHLFVNKFDSDEFRQISFFYFLAESIENERNTLANGLILSIEEKEKYLQKLLIDLAFENWSNEENYNKKKNDILSIVHKESYFFEPSTPKDRLNLAIIGMPNILNTSIGIKLKRYAKYY